MFEHFFIVGAQRSGTSYLYHLLAEHPEIEMAKPLKPEPKFFLKDELFECGLEYYENHFFAGKDDAWLRGEKSTSYIESEKVAQRIAHSFPKAKIIFLLRDPIERAISNYYFSLDNKLETLPISEAFFKEDERWFNYDHQRVSVSPFAYLRRGLYIDYSSIYERYFPADQLKIILYEKLIKNMGVVKEIYAFLNATSNFTPYAHYKDINKSNRLSSSLSPDLECYLRDYFDEPNKRLASHFKLDLSDWQRS